MKFIRKLVGKQLAKPEKSFQGKLVMRMMERKNRYLIQKAVEHSNIQPHDSVLEVGFGHGAGLKFAAEKINGGKVYGVDVSDLAHLQCEENLYSEISTGKVHLIPCSVAHMPFNTNSIDKAFSCNSFYFWPNIPRGCAELHRVLKPGGSLLTVQNIDSVLKRKQAGGFEHANVDFLAYMLTLEKVGFADVRIDYCKDEHSGKKYEVIHATAS